MVEAISCFVAKPSIDERSIVQLLFNRFQRHVDTFHSSGRRYMHTQKDRDEDLVRDDEKDTGDGEILKGGDLGAMSLQQLEKRAFEELGITDRKFYDILRNSMFGDTNESNLKKTLIRKIEEKLAQRRRRLIRLAKASSSPDYDRSRH